MSRDPDPMLDHPRPAEKAPDLPRTKNYPICPECGCNTIVIFTPPYDGLVGIGKGYRLYAEKNWNEYVDWRKAQLYCCNGETNCNVTIPVIGGLMTPVKEARRRFIEAA